MDYKIGRSVSLYSYQEEYYLGKMDLEACIREASKAELPELNSWQNK